MDEEKKVSSEKLLYDPMFAQKAVLDWTDSEKGGIFGKSIVKKTLFIVFLLAAIAGALFFSFSSISKSKYKFEQLDSGYKLAEFSGQKADTVLRIDYVRDENDKPDLSKPVTDVRQYTVTGNDVIQFIFIGKDVINIEKTAFYYCTSLCAIFVDEANENYTSVDGILYKKENGTITEAVLCPQKYTRYKLALADGLTAPSTAEDAEKLAAALSDEEKITAFDEIAASEENTVGASITIPSTVKKIGQLCFAYCDGFKEIKIPESVTEIETMAFFGCSALKEINLPDSIEIIGSDAFSKCKNVESLFIPGNIKSIGHHAFWNCENIENVSTALSSFDGVETGQHWLPQYRKVLMKDRDVTFNAERGIK